MNSEKHPFDILDEIKEEEGLSDRYYTYLNEFMDDLQKKALECTEEPAKPYRHGGTVRPKYVGGSPAYFNRNWPIHPDQELHEQQYRDEQRMIRESNAN